MFRNIEPELPASITSNDEETMHDSKTEARQGEEVSGRNDLTVIAQENDQKISSRLWCSLKARPGLIRKIYESRGFAGSH